MSQNLPYIFNVRISLPDNRDFSLKKEENTVRDVVDLRAYDSPVEDQDTLGSCVSHAITSAYENLIKQKYPDNFTELSRLYHYYHTRYLEGTTGDDYGVLQIRNALRALKKYCICAEQFWPYNVYNYGFQPAPDAYADAPKRSIMNYASLEDNTQIINSLDMNYPVVVGLYVFPDFMSVSSTNPIIRMPGLMESSVGGHSMTLVGYSKPERTFLAKNSFGQDWGDNGYCWIPFDYATSYFFDRWMFDINNQEISYVY